MDLFMKLISNGGVLIYPLLLCSFLSVTIICERIVFWYKFSKSRDEASRATIMKCCCFQKTLSPMNNMQPSKDVIVSLIMALRKLPIRESRAHLVDSEIGKTMGELKRYHHLLDTIITISPLLGILGTVVGIIASFNVLGDSQIQNPQAITFGISQALITTAFGLSIAIFTVVPYNFFNSRINRFIKDVEFYVSKFESCMECSSNEVIANPTK